MDKFIQIGEKFGMEGEKLLEFVEKQQQLEEEKEERRRILEEDRRKEEEEKEERRRREDEERETIEAAKREHELELARLGQGRNDTERAEVQKIGPRHPSFPHLLMARTT